MDIIFCMYTKKTRQLSMCEQLRLMPVLIVGI